MNVTVTEQARREAPVVLPKTTLAMLMCGIVAFAAAGAASAAGSDTDVPSVSVKYDPSALATEGGARQLYARIADAAAQVCPQYASSPHWVTRGVEQCREQSISRAVMKVNSPRLVAVYQRTVKSG